MADRKPTLDGIQLFKELTPAELRAVEKACAWRDYPPDEQIFDRDTDSRDIYLVVSGRVRIVNFSASGREVSFDDIDAGGYFGELAAIDGAPRSASVVAIEPTTVASLAPAPFMELVVTHPRVATTLLKRLAHVIRASTERIMDLSTLGAHNRVYAELLRLAREAGGEDCEKAAIKPIPTHSDIASRVSTTRETVARVLGELQHSGLVKRERSALVVGDVEKLADMVEDFRGE